MLKDLLKPGDWMTKVDLLFHDTSSDKPQEVAAVQVARINLPVQLSPFWVVVGSVGLYQDYKANCSHPQVNGPEDDHLHRRHPDLIRDKVSLQRANSWALFLLENLGFT